MPTTTTLNATGTPTQVAGTWTNPTSATGSPNSTGGTANTSGTTPNNCGFWSNAARSATATLELAGYDFSGQVAAGSIVNTVTATIAHAESSTSIIATVTAQLFSGATAIGTAQTVARSTTYTTTTISSWGALPTVAQLADLRVRVTSTRSNSTTTTVQYIDAVGLVVDYTALSASGSITLSGGGTVALPKISTFSDNFATADSTKWTFGAAATVTGGQLVETCNTSYTGVVTSVAQYDLTGSQTNLQLVQAANGGAGNVDSQFYLSADTGGATNALYFVVENGLLYAATYVGGTYLNRTSVTFSATSHAYQQFRESGGTVYWETSATGAAGSWSTLWSMAAPIAVTALYVGINTGHFLSSGSPSPNTTIWDNLNPSSVTTPTVNAGPDTIAHNGSSFWRTATETGGSITGRAWTITAGPAGVGTTIGTAAALVWTPSVNGTYTLQYAATNSAGTDTDTVTVTVVTTPAALAQWQTALSAKTAQAVFVGDSITEGQGASARANRWLDLIEPTIRTSAAVSGGGVPGYLPSYFGTYGVSAWTPYTSRAGTHTQDESDVTLGHRDDVMAAGATLTYTVTGTSADLHWIAGYGSFTWAVDGGSATTVNTSGTTGAPSRTAITLGASGSHTLVITTTTLVHFAGVMVYDGDATSGVRFYDGGHTGYDAISAANRDYLGDDSLWGLLNADLYVIELGTNNYLYGTNDQFSSTQVRDALRQVVDQIRSAATSKDPSIALLIPGNWVSGLADPSQTESWATYQAAIASLGTDDTSISVIYMPNLTSGQLAADTLHPNDSGHTAVASTVGPALSLSSAPASASGSITLGGTATASARPSATGAVTLTGTAASTAAATGTGLITLSGVGNASARPTAAGSVTLAGTGTAVPNATAAGSVTLGGTATAGAQATAAGSVLLGGAATAAGQVAATGSITLAGTGTAAARATAAGSVTLSGTATGSQPGTSTAAGTVTLTGTATATAGATAAGSVTLAGSANARASSTAAGSVTLTGQAAPAAAASSGGSITLAGAAQLSALANAAGTIQLAGSAAGTGGAGPVLHAGPDETLLVLREKRTLLVLRESRTGLVIRENRTVRVAAESRVYTVPADDRVLIGSLTNA